VELHVKNEWIQQVEGQPHASHFLDSYAGITNKEDTPFLVDILNCQHGCNLGTGALCGDEHILQVGKAMYKAKETLGELNPAFYPFVSLEEILPQNRNEDDKKSTFSSIKYMCKQPLYTVTFEMTIPFDPIIKK